MLASRNGGTERDELQRFLFEHLESYEELELVILLRRQRERDWSAELAERLAVVMLMSVNAIERLRAATVHRFADTLRLRH